MAIIQLNAFGSNICLKHAYVHISLESEFKSMDEWNLFRSMIRETFIAGDRCVCVLLGYGLGNGITGTINEISGSEMNKFMVKL